MGCCIRSSIPQFVLETFLIEEAGERAVLFRVCFPQPLGNDVDGSYLLRANMDLRK